MLKLVHTIIVFSSEVIFMELGARKLQILNSIIETFIETGEPVGSKLLCEFFNNTVSSATIRNDMAELVCLGLLEQPHTSAGRIPSQMGYRLYIDRLMQPAELSFRQKCYINSMLAELPKNTEDFLSGASKLLSKITGFTVFYTPPYDKIARIRQIDLMPTGNRSLLLIMMCSCGTISKSICRLDIDLTPDTLNVLRRVLNEQFSGRTLMEISPALIQNAAATLRELVFIIAPLLVTIQEAASNASKREIKFEGLENLLRIREFDYIQAQQIFKLFSGNELLTLFDKPSSDRIYIGKESGFPELEFLSMLFATYTLNRMGTGVIGIIGPTRMNYKKAYSLTEYFSESVSDILNSMLAEDNI